jgi:hypothetical protein
MAQTRFGFTSHFIQGLLEISKRAHPNVEMVGCTIPKYLSLPFNYGNKMALFAVYWLFFAKNITFICINDKKVVTL